MDSNFIKATWAIVLFVGLTTICIISALTENKNQNFCKSVRIGVYSDKYFTWGGILELSKNGKFQPPCL
jgi:hypothetical protein